MVNLQLCSVHATLRRRNHVRFPTSVPCWRPAAGGCPRDALSSCPTTLVQTNSSRRLHCPHGVIVRRKDYCARGSVRGESYCARRSARGLYCAHCARSSARGLECAHGEVSVVCVLRRLAVRDACSIWWIPFQHEINASLIVHVLFLECNAGCSGIFGA